jgi:hypothetical protein
MEQDVDRQCSRSCLSQFVHLNPDQLSAEKIRRKEEHPELKKSA